MITTRRAFLGMAAAALSTSLTPGFAQSQAKLWRIGAVSTSRAIFIGDDRYGALVRGIREVGFAEGKDFVIDFRSPEGKTEALPELAADLLRQKVDIVVTGGTPATAAFQKASTMIPIVMVNVADPVATGLVKSLSRPGGNITGHSDLTGELDAKALEILLQIAPRANRVAALFEPANPASLLILKSIQAAAQKKGVTLLSVPAGNSQEIEKAFQSMSSGGANAVILASGGFFNAHAGQLAELAAKYRWPLAGGMVHVEAGALMSYRVQGWEGWYRAGIYVGKIMKGAKPADLPVEQSTKFELVLNLRTAKKLGLTIPNSVLLQADKVIE